MPMLMLCPGYPTLSCVSIMNLTEIYHPCPVEDVPIARAQQRWSAFSEEVDNVIPLSQTKPTVRRIKPNLKPIKSYTVGIDIILNTTSTDTNNWFRIELQ